MEKNPHNAAVPIADHSSVFDGVDFDIYTLARLAEALKVLEGPFKVLDGALADRSYLLGEDFTVADLNVAAVISRAIDMDLSATPRVGEWLKRCLERPAARAVQALRAQADAETSVEVVRAIARHNRL